MLYDKHMHDNARINIQNNMFEHVNVSPNKFQDSNLGHFTVAADKQKMYKYKSGKLSEKKRKRRANQ